MRIVIDMQGAQSTGSRNRGIGRYTLSLTTAIVKQRGTHEILLALNGAFPETIEVIRATFDGILPQKNIVVWQTPGPLNSMTVENAWRRHTAELTREAFLANLEPDVVLVSSLFEGLVDDAVTSINKLSCTTPTAAILYDLIPFIHRNLYLKNPVIEAWYENKLDHLRRADLILAISESSRQEGIRYLGFPPETSVNISTAADPYFQPQLIESECEKELRQRYGLSRSFVMYTGGIDHRKNIEGLIRAYAQLPNELRMRHQLAVVCAIQHHDKVRLERLAKQHGFKEGDLVLTGFVSEKDLVAFNNLCKVFVFPSWHEGFGLPALEAMTCGRAVIGANTSSSLEVIGREDALFAPRDDKAIANKLAHVLTDDVFRGELERHGLERAKKFSWNESARRAIAAFEEFDAKRQRGGSIVHPPVCRPTLAYVSPLPPERSGISYYSAELLPELARYYDIDVIVAQDTISDPWIKVNCRSHTDAWFMEHAHDYDRVLYHFGNSRFHQHMFDLLEHIPGVVVLHDFYLSGIVAYMDTTNYTRNGWAVELYRSHGYKALQERYHNPNTADVVWKYPCNLSVLQRAQGVIAHSENARQLAKEWYGTNHVEYWSVIPHLRAPRVECDRAGARYALDLNNDNFVICSFGLLSPTKLNHRLLEAWLASELAKDKRCVLVFVGENGNSNYGQQLRNTIKRNKMKTRIRITGWTDTATFRQYLAAADLGVQLRTLSRGETSGTVIDCMNYGLPTIVNANGSMADLPDDSVWKLPDEFTDSQLIDALETLYRDKHRREQLGARAREIIVAKHAPRICANQYFEFIENIHRASATGIHALTRALAKIEPMPADVSAMAALAEAVAKSIPPQYAQRQLLIDVSGLVQCESERDIQRMARSILKELMEYPPVGYRIEPVYANVHHNYRYARSFTCSFLGCPSDVLTDDPVEFLVGDIFLGLDSPPQVVTAQKPFYQELRRHGVHVWFVVYEMLRILNPQFFDEGATEEHRRWIEVVAEGDGVICISKAVADEFSSWREEHGPVRFRPLKISWFNPGADIDNSTPTPGNPGSDDAVLRAITRNSSFLMVGTVEPRKGHAQTLSAFEQLWAKDVQANLVIVGKRGSLMEELIDRLRHHSERGKRLFWLDDISDEHLEKVYSASTCLIAASEGEGDGLPLVEAAQHKLPIIARDIKVFREVANDHAFYFSGNSADDLACAVKEWLRLYETDLHPRSDDMSWLSWKESTQQLLDVILPDASKSTLKEVEDTPV